MSENARCKSFNSDNTFNEEGKIKDRDKRMTNENSEELERQIQQKYAEIKELKERLNETENKINEEGNNLEQIVIEQSKLINY